MKQNHELTHTPEAIRRGATPGHIRVALSAKAMIAHIRAHPGCTRQEIYDALGDTYVAAGFDLLRKHKLAHRVGSSPARWYPGEVKP